MENEIIEILGKNHKNTVEFTEDRMYNEPYGCYTYKGCVYVLKDGMDYDFDELSELERMEVASFIKKGKYKLNKRLQ